MPIALYWSSLKTQDGGFSRTSDHSLPPVLTWHHTWWLVKTVFLLVQQLLGPMPNRVQQQYSIFLNQSLPLTWSKPQLSRTMQFKGLRHFWVTPNYLAEVNQANGFLNNLCVLRYEKIMGLNQRLWYQGTTSPKYLFVLSLSGPWPGLATMGGSSVQQG